MSDALTLFGEVRSAAHRADTDALVAALESLEALGDPTALGRALAYAHELLWKAGARAVAGALRRWPHPDALPMLVWRHTKRYSHDWLILRESARAPHPHSAWIDEALIGLLPDASVHVWLAILELDLPRIHHAALEHPVLSVTSAARVPARVSIAHRRKRSTLIKTRSLDDDEVSALVEWADGDFERLCALSESSNREVWTHARGELLELLLEQPLHRRLASCSSHPAARRFARSTAGEVAEPVALARYVSAMSFEHRELYRVEVAPLLSGKVLSEIALSEPDPEAARAWGRRALASIECAEDHGTLRVRFPDLRVDRELAPTADLAWRWMRGRNEDEAVALLSELDLFEHPELRAGLARRTVEALLASTLEPAHVERIAWLPLMFGALRREFARAGTLTAEHDEWRTRTFGLPRDGEVPAGRERALARPAPRRRRGAPKGARPARGDTEVDEYFEDLAHQEWFGDAVDDWERYEDFEPDYELTGGVSFGAMVGTTRRDTLGTYLELERLSTEDVASLAHVLHERRIDWVTTSAGFQGDLAALERACASLEVRLDPGCSARALARQDDGVCTLELDDPGWRQSLWSACRVDPLPELELVGEVREADVAELADALDRECPDEALFVRTHRHDLRAAVALIERLDTRVKGATIELVRGLMDGGVAPGGRVDCSCLSLTDEDLWELGRLVTPGELVVGHTRVTGPGLAALGDEDLYPRLRKIDARGLDVTLADARALLGREDLDVVAMTASYADQLELVADPEPRLELAAKHPRLLEWTLAPVGQAPICFGLSERDLRALAARPELLLIDALNLRYCALSPELVEVFLCSPTARNLRTIALSRDDLSAAAGTVLRRDRGVAARLVG